ncbi:MAG: regulatory protein RecX [Rhodocyclaceae bacterium]|nr:regulatory protein RecX [Rhodocyclaceae bacterium]
MPDLRVQALKLLTRRDHSRAELRAKLASEAETSEALDAVLDALQGERLLSDQRYAMQRVVAKARRFGDTRIKHDLRLHGVGEADIAAALPEGGNEADRCHAVWARKFAGLPQSPAERGKQMRFLQYRGFSIEAIQQAMRRGLGGEDE